ncbi:MAG TPA: phosphoribosyltransferase family protein [bacterium]|nr:phosphoribosyltransferase family protein [bacterium]
MKGSEPLLTPSQIRDAVERTARSVLSWMKDRQIHELRILSVLEGARPFTRDLVAVLRKEGKDERFMVYEVKVKGTSGTKLLEERDLELDGLDLAAFGGHAILVVDDLADSGKTLLALKEALVANGAGEVRTAVLIRKWGPRSVDLDFCGLDLGWDRAALAREGLKDRWLYGYGMDLDGRQRDLDWVGAIGIEQ